MVASFSIKRKTELTVILSEHVRTCNMENRFEAQAKTTHFQWIFDLFALTKHSDAFPITGLELGVIVSIKCGPLLRILHLQLDSWFKNSNSSVIERTIELYVLLRHVSKIKKSKRNDNLLANAIRKLAFD